MSDQMHSTDELKRQYDAAKSRVKQASDAEREAGKRYIQRLIDDELAKYEAMGIKVGTKVVVIRNGWVDGRTIAGFAGVEADGYSMTRVKPVFLKIKKDGTVSKARNSIYYFDAIEPFVEEQPTLSQQTY